MLKRVKKIVMLMVVFVLTLESIIPQNVSAAAAEGEKRTIDSNILSEKNTNFEGADGDGVPYWWYGSSAKLSLSSNCIEGNSSMLVEPNGVGSYVGGANNLTDSFEVGKTYEYSFYAKLADGNEDGQVALVLNYMYDESGYDNTQQVLAKTDDEYTFTNDEWTNVTGTFTVSPKEGEYFREVHLIFSAVNSDGAFLVDDFKVGAPQAEVTGDNIIYDPQFSVSENSPWYAYANGAKFSCVESEDNDKETIGDNYGYITGRTQNWECIGQDVVDRVKNNTSYAFSFYAKLSDDYGDETREMQLCTTKKDSNDDEQVYDQVAMTGGKGTVSSKEWTKIEGVLDVAWTGELEILTVKFSEQGDAIEADTYGSYCIANVSMYEVASTPKEIERNLVDLKAKLLENNVERTGVAVPQQALTDEARMELVTKHYNSITAENEMKPESILGQTPTISENGYPILNFKSADRLMDFVLDYNEANPDKEPIKIRGHVLVWHSQTPEWFFHEDYDAKKGYVEPEEMLGRLENYIQQVMEHFDGEDSKYKGTIYAWDVVNEAINDYNGGLRTENSSWYNVFGNDDFITNAFVYANKYAPANVKLFYNDYNETVAVKAEGICKLLEKIKGTSGARIDGMGMQGHYDMLAPTVGQFTSAAKAYSEALDGGEIIITELDFKSSQNYDGTNKNAEYQKQAYRYKAIYEAILSLKDEGINFSGITFWGTHDSASWLNDSNSVGGAADGTRKQCPLLFDENLKAKPAYWAFVDASKLEPAISEIIAIETENIESPAVNKYSFAAGEAEVTFATAWNKDEFQVKVWVKDATNDNMDQVTLYIDSTNSRDDNIEKITVTRAESEATSNGYVATFNTKIDDLAVTKKIGMDFKVTDGTNTYSWNDLTNKQDTSSKYYGQVTMKPFMEINKGTPTIDGTIDSIWSKVDAVPLTIKGSAATATSTVKLLWDNDNLYVLFQVKDDVLNKDNSAAHEQDSVEVFIDENNHKSDSYESDDKQYRINYDNEASFNGKNCNADNLKSATVVTTDGYLVEAAYKWTEITPAMSDMIGLELQINDASAEGKRVGTMSWYDESGNGWSSPSVFGNAMLSAEVNVDPETKPEPKPETKPEPKPETKPETKPEVVYFAKFSVEKVSIQKGKSSTALAKDVQIADGDKIVSWETSNKKVVSVTNAGKIKGIKTGKAVITVKTQQGKTASITVNVVKGKVATTKITLKNATTGKTIKKNSTITLKVKKTLKLKASVAPMIPSDKVVYKTSNKKIAKVSKKGVITAKKKGTATIKVTSGKKSVKIKVKVTK